MSDKPEFNLVTLDRKIAELAKEAQAAVDRAAPAEEVAEKYQKLAQAIAERRQLTVEAAKRLIPAVLRHFADKK